tara:strand:+ start:739 stop:966 length:228 start_codon:yes stop_codon:yes gene_type:complete
MKSLLALLIAFSITGCVSSKYSLVSGQYGWDKQGEKGSKYSSETMFKINSQTGETWKMTFEQSKGYYWELINQPM